MTKLDVEEYLAALEETKRNTLEKLRRRILQVIPDAEQCISYGMPAFKVEGKVIAGFAAFKNHLSYLPHSGFVLSEPGTTSRDMSSRRGRYDSQSIDLCRRRSSKKLVKSEKRKSLG